MLFMAYGNFNISFSEFWQPCIDNSTGHADHKPAVCNPTTVPMNDFKPFGCNNYDLYIAVEKSNIRDNHEISCHFNDGNSDADLIVFEEKSVLDSSCIKNNNECFKIPDLDSSAFTISALNKHPKPEDDISPLKDDKDSNLQCNLHSAIKDISIDMGVPLVDKIFTKNLSCDKNDNLGEDVQKETLSGETTKTEDTKIVDIKPVLSESAKGTYIEDELMEPLGSKCHRTGNAADDCQYSESNKNEPSEVQCRGTVNITENNGGHQTGSELQDMQNSEDKTSANVLMGDQDGFADGNTSFSSVGPMSGLITYSGLVPHPGNISIRSDSSTTSTRSFAFPVLQSEWNSSPVRMSKAERRYRKQRGWRQGLLCCRF
ncbi:hypothetical protein DM860_000282 [Cuscuta australis]|uniref:Uncharacterized protein n=1 Tax=Cuscuta australis TaxID=267555 RepID=A0A328CYR5_9ASTE|nr:hypothetical protein DM860_000282 [Cuscuta australis]